MIPVHPLDIQLPLTLTPDPTTRRRSSTFTTITNWAQAVQPGTPAPLSPRRPSLIRRVASPKTPQFPKVDLTSLGYTSVFLNLPITPATPSPLPQPTMPGKSLKKMNSIGLFRRKSVIGGHAKSKSVSATAPRKSNRTHPPLPPALQNELLLMQFASGGSLDSNAQRMMANRANGNAVDAVYRDENGVMWLDEHERVEYEALIPVHSSLPPSPWIQFPSQNGSKHDEDAERRPSVVSLSPTERELDGAAVTLVRPASPMTFVDGGLETIPPPASAVSSIERTERRKRRRPAPLKLHSSSSIPQAQQGFEDSFEPSSAEAAALAAGMYSYASRRVGQQGYAKRAAVHPSAIHMEAGSAPADVISFDTTSRKSNKMNLARRAKALFRLQ